MIATSWFFLVQPRPISEGFSTNGNFIFLNIISFDVLFILSVNASPDIFKAFLPRLAITSPTAHASYCKNFDDPACIHAMCEDYRASSPGGGSVPQGPDYVLDKSDLENVEGGRRIKCDLMVLWAKRSAIAVFWDAKKEWRKFCAGEVVGREVDSGHFIPEGESTIVIIRNSLLVMWLCDAEMDTKELVEEIFGFFKV
jgi:haloacetate dehalogenase